MIQAKDELQQALHSALTRLAPGTELQATFESPKHADHGDLAVTAAMGLAKALKRAPRDIATELVAALQREAAVQRWVEALEIAGPGFINLRLKAQTRQRVITEVLQAAERFGRRDAQRGRVMVEFVSANPTGPLHVGHGRNAALGDCICNLLDTQGWSVAREFYYNDAGVQIATLGASVQARLRGCKPGDAAWPENAYNGEYIADIAADFKARKTVRADDREVTASGDADDLAGITQFAVAYLRHEQDLDLRAFGVRFDTYYLESSLYTDGRVERAVAQLQAAGKTYEHDGALWLRSTDYGDDKDRVMRKSDGTYTYFVPDVAYHISKWERGFTKVINVQGSDHHGTVARVRAGLQAAGVGIPAGYPAYVLYKMITVMRGGQEVKISKRAGSYVTLRDLIDWTGRDAVRFFLSSRKSDTEFVFDVDLALKRNDENPVFYVQYAHARICSVLALWATGRPQGRAAPSPPLQGASAASGQPLARQEQSTGLFSSGLGPVGVEETWDGPAFPHERAADAREATVAELALLTAPTETALMRTLARYPDVLARAAEEFAPHDLTFYLRDVAAAFHTYYAAERFMVDDAALARARMALLAATRQVLRNGFAVLGISAPDSMARETNEES